MSRKGLASPTIALSTRLLAGILLLAVAVAASGCSQGEITVQDAWVRPAEAGQNTAIYFEVRNEQGEDDRLISVSTDLAEMTMLHETVVTDGVASMQHVEGGIAVAAGQTLTFEPGGYHVMVMGLTRSLSAGDEVPVEFTFERAGTITLAAPVTDAAR